MAKFIALTSTGLLPALEEEIKILELPRTRTQGNGVWFEGSWKHCYQANLHLRSATRVLLPILDFHAYKPEELYNNILKHDFTKYITTEQTIAVEAHGQNHQFNDQRFIALKVKDAIVDQFRDKFGKRPDVDGKNPDLLVVVRLFKGCFSVSIDTSGFSLTKRGYREQTVEAPIREHIAASLLTYAQWSPEEPLLDPMCGSGTFLIEAALKAKHIPPTQYKQTFAFEKFKTFQPDIWAEVLKEAHDKEQSPPLELYGFDNNQSAIRAATENAKAAKVRELINFKPQNLTDLSGKNFNKPGLIIVNPPYGERLGELEKLKVLYSEFASILKKDFKGWRLGFLSGHAELSAALGLKAHRKWPLMNSKLECKFLLYEIR